MYLKGLTASEARSLGLTALIFSIFLVGYDYTAFSVALPSIQKTFQVDITTTMWLVNAYALAFGVSVISCGRLADMLGRRRTFFIGATLFSVFSLLGGFSLNIWMLMGCRVMLSIGGAMMWPSVIGMTYHLLDSKRAGIAGGLLMLGCGVANSLGPIIGGILTDTLGWRWILFLNLPLTLVAMLICWKLVISDLPSAPGEHVDLTGLLFLSLALLALLLGLDLSVDVGFVNNRTLLLFLGFVLFLSAFVWLDYRSSGEPLIPVDVVKNKRFFAEGVATLLVSVAFIAALMFVPQFLSKVWKFTAIQSGIALLPMMIMFGATSFLSGHLYERFGAKLLSCFGALFMWAGMLVLSKLSVQVEPFIFTPGMGLMGIGMGLFYPTITTAAILILRYDRASLAAAIIYMFQIIGGAIGLGLNTTIVALAPDLATGISRAFLMNAHLALLGMVVSVFFINGRGKGSS
ncbi:MFS transporter [Microbulbifer sp. THAF38]|uniref:MFS transporter n=1 Tax=Microbulbifer sp. THAF38 TaxID=2587856 RepID=UPI00126798AC|nr:MFS transporter [Microbulbifer sp. THAF38]QFT54526.1 Multidrug resistance protein stp [Microbulbifer sp. THAF38]